MRTALLAFTLLAAVPTVAAHAAPVAFRPATSFASKPFVLDLGAATYTFSNSGDYFSPVRVATGGTATIAAFGGFLGIPLAPTSFFTDPGRAPLIDAFENYQPFPGGGVVDFSISPAYLALAFTLADGLHYGYALTEGARLVTYGYETTPGASIQAPAVPAPEPAALALLGLGGALLVARRSLRAR